MTRLLLIGDLQRTLFIERLLGREQNDRERAFLLESAAHENVEAAWLLGDVVAVGGKASCWKYFDRVAKKLMNRPIAKNAIYGNHDYWGFTAQARAAMVERFTNLGHKNFGEIRYGSLAVLYLDSNREMMTGPQWNEQLRWFEESLATLDADERIKHVTVFGHHPPYTNSKRYAGHRRFKDDWVAPFIRAKKTRAWISGHVHAYEKFTVEKKQFIVMGSSGGPRAALYLGKEQRIRDEFVGHTLRPFIYATLETDEDWFQIQIHGFDKHDLNLRPLDRIEIHA